MRNRSCFTEEKMGYGRQSRQNRKENPVGNWTFRLRKMQKNLPHYPKQKEDLRLLETDRTLSPSLFSRTFRGPKHAVPQCLLSPSCFARFSYSRVSVISMVETIRALVSPSLGGISCVPIAILLTFRSFRKRFLVISAASTAVVIAWPLAFKVIAFSLLADRPVIIART